MPRDPVAELAAPLMGSVTAVPSVDLGCCAICHSSTKAPWPQCWKCNEGRRILDGRVPRVLPVSLSVHRWQLHHALRLYKDGYDQPIRSRFTQQVGALTALFLRHHADCLGGFDVVTTVPSVHRAAFEEVVTRLGKLRHSYEHLVDAVPAPGHREFDRRRYRVRRQLEGERVLIADDTWTTGASVLSATAAIRAAGGIVNTILVVGRHVQPAYEPTAELLERMRAAGLVWDLAECVVCRGGRTLF